MPQAALVAGIDAVAQLGGAIIGSRAASGAQKAQLKANQDALNYERQREAEAKKEREAARAAYQKAWNEWALRNPEGIKRYGVPVGFQVPTATTSTASQAGRWAAPAQAPSPTTSPSTLGAMALEPPQTSGGALGVSAPTPPPTQGASTTSQPPTTLGATGGWQDWNRYLNPGV